MLMRTTDMAVNHPAIDRDSLLSCTVHFLPMHLLVPWFLVVVATHTGTATVLIKQS